MITNHLFFSAKIRVSNLSEQERSKKAQALSRDSGKPVATLLYPQGDRFIVTENDLLNTIQKAQSSATPESQARVVVYDALANRPGFSIDPRLDYVNPDTLAFLEDIPNRQLSGSTVVTESAQNIILEKLLKRLKEPLFNFQTKQ